MKPDIRSITFQLLETPSRLGEQVRMTIQGEGPFGRAKRLRIRVGDQGARIGAFSLLDGSLDAFLATEPAAGAPVLVGWDDEEETDTGITYERPPIA
jgi:hypothetical protein